MSRSAGNEVLSENCKVLTLYYCVHMYYTVYCFYMSKKRSCIIRVSGTLRLLHTL